MSLLAGFDLLGLALALFVDLCQCLEKCTYFPGLCRQFESKVLCDAKFEASWWNLCFVCSFQFPSSSMWILHVFFIESFISKGYEMLNPWHFGTELF